MNKIEKNSLRSYKKIALLLKEDLIKGIYKIGDRLPPEREIAERFGVSRTIIREALIMLELNQWVKVKKGSGVYVLKLPTQTNMSENFLNLEEDIGPFELLQARQLLESSIAEFAAIQATRNDILKLKDIIQREKDTLSQGQDDYMEDEEFHVMIAKITQNEVLITMQKQLWDYRKSSMWAALHSHISNFTYRKRWIDDHEAIMVALKRKDPILARKSMWQHLENVKQILFELSDIDDPEFDGYLFNVSPLVVGI